MAKKKPKRKRVLVRLKRPHRTVAGTEKHRVTEKSLANLKPFKPGAEWKGNAGGRPKKLPINDRIAEQVEQPLPKEILRRLKWPEGKTYGDLAA